MVKVINEYKGVILLFLALVLTFQMVFSSIRLTSTNSNTNQVSYYEN